nr:Uncharacterised protein [Klebsiella pneumoniae]
MGALLNEKPAAGWRKALASVLKDGSPLQFNKKYTVGRLNNQETRYITIPLHARFISMARRPAPARWSRI